jgi:hypothetical protein
LRASFWRLRASFRRRGVFLEAAGAAWEAGDVFSETADVFLEAGGVFLEAGGVNPEAADGFWDAETNVCASQGGEANVWGREIHVLERKSNDWGVKSPFGGG